MKLNVLRMVTDFLNDPTHGVNALLGSIPLDDGESAPPALTAIVDTTRANDVARLFADPDERPTPFGFVFDPDDLAIEGWVANQITQGTEGQLTIGLAFVVGTAQTAAGLRDAMLYRRAARRSLNRLNGNDQVDARKRNQIYITRTASFTEGASWAQLDGGTLAAAPLFPRYQVRDDLP
jgi:hypothetical protein